jgi:ubiquinone/menaquinone biosynthesis C-methylase UbiE
MAMSYDAGAAAYDQLTGRWSQLFADAALGAVKPEPGDSVLDLATGTADAAVLASQLLGSASTVVGVDLRCRCCALPARSLKRHMFSS